ncbi:MAG: metallophosphoesterase, partial [Kiritimatiellae bacterium]|nr:metallophosphoesterase [Kiritimatiellia bacterium]
CHLWLRRKGADGTLKFFVIGDTHFGFADGRDAEYSDFYRRMGQCPAPRDALSGALKRAAKAKADVVALVGDIISFPTLANVETLAHDLEESGLDWLYTAGNHDWHFEGDGGSDIEQRNRWIAKRLSRFYRGENPLCYSKTVKGVRFVMIDNSAYHILPEQLRFWKSEVASGEPVVLCMHIPLWVEGFSICTCGNPAWGAAKDPYWKIERRERWAERASPETFEFRESVLAAENLVGVFTGHIHRLEVARKGRASMFTVPANRDGSCMEVTVEPA